MFDQLGEAINDEQHLKSLRITIYCDKNQLENWPCSQLSNLSVKCEELELNALGGNADSRAILMDMAGSICQVSQCLRRLTLRLTGTSADVGLSFLSALADSELGALEYIDFSGGDKRNYSGPHKWFSEKEECVDTLIQALQRQVNLQTLRLYRCRLTDDQSQKIRDALQVPDCRLIITDEEEDAYVAEKKAEEDAKKAAAEAAKKALEEAATAEAA